MNKDELLNELYKLNRFEVSIGVLDFMSKTAVKFDHVLALVEQLDEPEKVVVPQFVADWIDAHDLHGNNPLREYRDLEIDFNEGWTNEKDAAVYHWVNENPYAFIDALRYGYEVEKEPLYYAKIKGHELIETEPILDDDTGKDVSEWNRNIYFIQQLNKKIVIDMKDSGLRGAKHFMTIKEWAELGINEANAEFEPVEETP